MEEYLIVDRIEGKYAVCEKNDRSMVDIELSHIDGNIQDGDVICFKDGVYTLDKEMTKKRLEEIEELTKGMWE